MLDRCYWPYGINLLTLNFAPATIYALYIHTHDSWAAPRPTSRIGRACHVGVRRHTATRTSVSTRARGSVPRAPLHGVGMCASGQTRRHGPSMVDSSP